MLAYEYKEDLPPYLHPCPAYASNGVQQGTHFARAEALDVRQVEVAKCHRLLDGRIEQLSFSIPRAKVDSAMRQHDLLWF